MSAPHFAPSATGGLAASLRTIGTTLGEMVSVRGALFGVELREEIERRKQRLMLGAFALVMLHAALLVATLLVVVAFWDTYRLASVAAMAVLYLGCGAAALARLRRDTLAAPAPFEASLRELQRDLVDFAPPR